MLAEMVHTEHIGHKILQDNKKRPQRKLKLCGLFLKSQKTDIICKTLVIYLA